MGMDEHEEDEQTEAAADPFSQMVSHSRLLFIASQQRLVNSSVHPASHALSVMNPFTRGRKRSLHDEKKFYLRPEAGSADGLQQV
jgi:hypothetical protein